ncbi:hypothetical protein ASPZODRAFT_160538 [Penicilliopsis zonata CBS 506.65]|uniref:Major facilitator superfamily (MFS) profile domain-containing protein n=1 Tax=Penicilliopsis zonata CBS 506.65 TaxID=1073090 RepID=A0A1L9SD00_9EURO|nr:hypothetical protein ASPZODRAFT_160538 [Penicilliopsis zonata CBS 506.65]OJJ45051.1 hypothetical protein ASPZODRAFT_160538 [Penicilliopsis zonata CBS 506.65]
MMNEPPPGHFYLAGRLFPRQKWYRNANMRWLYFYILALIITNTANGFDNSMMNGLQTLSYWQDYFNHPHGPTLGLFNCVMSAGALSGLLFLPFLMDRYGRKPCLVLGSLFMLLGVGLQSGALNFAMFVAARWILGVGDILVICTAPLLVAEIAPPQDRAVLVTISGATYYTGAFIAAWTTYGTLKIESNWAWRTPSLIQGLFTLMMLAVVRWIPESPRFYVSRDQPEKALQMLATYHANGDENDELVQTEFTEITTAIALERHARHSVAFLDFLRTPGNRRRLVIVVSVGVFSQLSGNGLVSYYLSIIMDSIGITSANEQLLINGALTTFNLVTNLFFCFFIDKWGRRPIYIVSTVGMLVAFVVWTILSARYAIHGDSSLGSGVLAMIFIYYLCYNAKSGLISSYTTEILPYSMRAKGYTIMEYALYASLFFTQYVNPVALDNIAWRYYIFYCCFLALEILVIWFFYVETRYVPLEEVTKFFDGEDVAAVTNHELQKVA